MSILFAKRKRKSAVELPEGALFSLLRQGYCTVLPGGEVDELVPEFVRILGINREIRTLQELESYLESSAFETLHTAVNTALKGGRDFTLQASGKAAEKREFEFIGSKLYADEGEVEAVLLAVRDITGQSEQIALLTHEKEALSASLQRLKSVLEAAPLPIWRRAEDLRIEYGNPGFAEIVEVPQEEIAEHPSAELHKQAQELARKVRDTAERHTERRHIVVDGERKLYDITEVPLGAGKGQAGFAWDISEFEKLEAENKKYASAQADFLESSVSAMAVYSPDTRLMHFNNAFVRLWKLDEAWLETRPTYGEILETLREKRRLPEQANFPAFKKEQIALFTSLIGKEEEFFYLPDGTVLRVLVIPYALGGLLFAYEDITSRLALERSFNTLSAVQRATLDNLHEGVAVFGEDGKLKLSNPVFAELWQLDPAFLSAEPHVSEIAERVKPLYNFGDDWEGFKKRLISQVSVRERRARRIERSDGTLIEWRSTPLPDGATLMTYIDVTDSMLVERSLREKNEALEDADRLKSEFLANVSYELRSPLTTIMGFSEVLLQRYFGELNPQQQEYIEGIHKSSTALMTLINDILDLASIEAGYLKLDIHEFDIFQMLSSVKFLAKERAKENDIQLKLICPPDIGMMLGDETRMKQVLFNLLSNAIKFTQRGGEVRVGAKVGANGEVVFWVEDNGMGIPEEARAKVFEKFFKGGSSKAHKSGTGLGLSIVKNFIDLHGGTVEIASVEGKGTTVTCTLLRANASLRQQPA